MARIVLHGRRINLHFAFGFLFVFVFVHVKIQVEKTITGQLLGENYVAWEGNQYQWEENQRATLQPHAHHQPAISDHHTII